MIESIATYESAETRYVVVNGHRIAYRRLGQQDGVPLLHLLHFGGNMDHVDPAVANGIAARQPLILFDAPGIGRSEGRVPWINKIDVFGYSMGGCVAQMLALNHPHLVRRLILVGTVPSIGKGVTPPPAASFAVYRRAKTVEEHRQAFIGFSFHPCEKSQKAAQKAWAKVIVSRPDRIVDVGSNARRGQLFSFAKFMKPELAHEGSYDRLHELKMHVLLVKGSNDVVLDDSTFRTMINMMSNACVTSHIYPDSGHACHFQYPEEFVRLAVDFLEAPLGVGRSQGKTRSAKL
ncbi:hypothetical protein QM012_005543 [Aureobasidium pullulans]|uniref:Serine aminopeptidase S33 domain-containing protein n=1 Tax=Aureobasidium pullulans TaxID=5580 RepID=A0ABR0T4Q0_AURPU